MTSNRDPTTGPSTDPPAAPSRELVILVDESDREIGQAEKLSVHRGDGQLHRAFSVMIYNDRGHLMLQKRAVGKYHFGGLWTNTCCGHPRPGETIEAAGRRRLNEEMGIDVELHEVGVFTYEADDEQTGLREREIDHVLAGRFEGQPTLNPDEAEGWLWAQPESLSAELAKHPERFTPWFEPAWKVAQRNST